MKKGCLIRNMCYGVFAGLIYIFSIIILNLILLAGLYLISASQIQFEMLFRHWNIFKDIFFLLVIYNLVITFLIISVNDIIIDTYIKLKNKLEKSVYIALIVTIISLIIYSIYMLIYPKMITLEIGVHDAVILLSTIFHAPLLIFSSAMAISLSNIKNDKKRCY